MTWAGAAARHVARASTSTNWASPRSWSSSTAPTWRRWSATSGTENPREDPVIHFYEHFLAAYDKRHEGGAAASFYTPRPVVSYIVRSVDELLRTEFGLPDGLADTTTWGEMAARHQELKVPDGTPPEQAFVQVLDPATGTGTFLVEVIDSIRGTMVKKWKAQGHSERKMQALWNEYVPQHLLPRLHGYELLMAPYAIAHLKIGLKLYETGYRFETDERARVYLTNALEPAGKEQLTLDFLPALAHEAAAVNEIKRKQRFTVVIGNPPYAGLSSNMGPWIDGLLKGRLPDRTVTASYYHVDGDPLGERKVWLQDDYVKFMRLSQWLIDETGVGVHGFISNHGYLDNPTFRGMRWSLMRSFRRIRVLDLHGNLKTKETPPQSDGDDNVFDIQLGVAIGLFTKSSAAGCTCHTGLWGDRESKYNWLLEHSCLDTEWTQLEPAPSSFYLFEPFDDAGTHEYYDWFAITDVMPVNVTGIVTARDDFVVDLDRETLRNRISDMRSMRLSDEAIRKKYFVGKGSKKYPPGDSRGWKLPAARRKLREDEQWDERYTPVLYRPFDTRAMYYVPWMVDWPRTETMPHMLEEKNVGLMTCRQSVSRDWQHAFATRLITDDSVVSNRTRERGYIMPLYLHPGVGNLDLLVLSAWPNGRYGRRPNLDPGFVERLSQAAALRFVSDGTGDGTTTCGPEDILAYIYAVFHSPEYRARYEAHLKLDFPRVPLPCNVNLFRQLDRRGQDLISFHVLESPALDDAITDYAGPKNPEVGRVGWSDGTVWLDAASTNARQGHRATKRGRFGFHGVPADVWHFQVGGYQVCHKWLKDRKGRTLSDEDIAHYQKIVVALNETIRIMAEIDNVIEAHGGWPDAFEPRLDYAKKDTGLLKWPNQRLRTTGSNVGTGGLAERRQLAQRQGKRSMIEKRLGALWERLQGKKPHLQHFLAEIHLAGIRGIDDLRVVFDYPVSVIAGGNASGKSTVLFAAACAYKVPGAGVRDFVPSTLFPDYRPRVGVRADEKREIVVEFDYATPAGRQSMRWRRSKGWNRSFLGRKDAAQPERMVYLRTLSNLSNPSEVRGVLSMSRLTSAPTRRR